MVLSYQQVIHILTNKLYEQMFEKLLIFSVRNSIIISRDFEHVFLQEGLHMKNNISKEFVIEMMKKVDASDKKFLLQIYTIIKRHLDKKGRH